MSGRNVRLAVKLAEDGRPRYLIAATAGLNPSMFSGVVSGRVTPSEGIKERIAATLGCDVTDLFAAEAMA